MAKTMRKVTKAELAEKWCKPCEGGVPPLSEAEVKEYLTQFPEWKYKEGKIWREFQFKNYYETTAFVNAVAWIAHREDHHPEITFGYKKCRITYWTHAANGLTENDFICATKVDWLVDQ